MPMYQDSVADELAYVVEHSGARFRVVQDQEQVDKLLEVREQVAGIESIVYLWPKGLRHYDPELVRDLRDVQAEGRRYKRGEFRFLRAEVEKGSGADTGVILYTSGTTGRPKGVVLTNDNVLRQAWAGPSSKVSGRTRTSSPTCRWPGSATTSSPTRSPTSPASASTVPRARRR